MTNIDAGCVWLTTLRRDGSLHTTPTWFLLRQNTFWIASSTANLKVRNIVREPRVSLAVDGSAQDPWVAQGMATIHQEIDQFRDLTQLFANKYNGWGATDKSQDGPRVLIAVSVTRWLLRPD